jgi:haloacetate dehalogenase
MFDGFDRRIVKIDDADINCVIGGNGPPVLLLHGAPQCLAEWAKLAPLLAEQFTVVCADLRGYGDSSKPVALPDHSNYSFRAMAADQVAVMKTLGFDEFHVVGHDRGGRVSYRMALDWPDRVKSLSVLDIVPTHTMYNTVNRQLATVYWLWYFLPLPAPFPERLIGADPDYFFENLLVSVGGTSEGLKAFDADMIAEYRRCWRDPEMIRGCCSDYRAGATIDLEHDAADWNRKVERPTLALWGGNGLVCKLFDIAGIWRDRCIDVQCEAVPGGHWFPESHPKETAERLARFFTSRS